MWWYDTALCFSMGMCFSIYRYQIEAWVKENLKTWGFWLLVFIIGFMASYFHKDHFFIYQIHIACFAASCLIFTMRYVVVNRALFWLGENLFELYILQRLPMIYFEPYIFIAKNAETARYVYVIICFATTVILSVIYKWTIRKRIESLLRRK